MALYRIRITGAVLVLALVSASAQAQQNPSIEDAGVPCRISWQDTTHGGDWQTTEGQAELTQIMPQGEGRFVAIGNGQATVTYHSANGCPIEGSPWTASYMVTVESDDGQTAQVDIASTDQPHSVVACGATAHFQFDVDAPDPPGVAVALHEGATPFSEDHASDHGHAGDQGAVTLHYCRPDGRNGR